MTDIKKYRNLYGKNNLIDEFMDLYDGTDESFLDTIEKINAEVSSKSTFDMEYKKMVVEFGRCIEHHCYKEELNDMMIDRWGDMPELFSLIRQFADDVIKDKADSIMPNLSAKAKENAKLLEQYILKESDKYRSATFFYGNNKMILAEDYLPNTEPEFEKNNERAKYESIILFGLGGELMLRTFINDEDNILNFIEVDKSGIPSIITAATMEAAIGEKESNANTTFQTADIKFVY